MNSDIDNFRKSFDLIYDQPSHKISKSASFAEAASWGLESRNDKPLRKSILENSSLATTTREEHAAQRPIRLWFGKNPPINQGLIGCHPDFTHLEGTNDTEFHYITTMFVDIKNSTRLSLLYKLKDVQHIKNSILRAASEAVRAMDGHVHRFMGDALMAYFGGKGQSKESTAMAAISCAAMLRTMMQEAVVPSLNARKIDANDLGFRIGIDFGDDSNVLWSSYGFSEVNEVTATSFFVDVSAKLQSMASKDCTMLGTNILDFLDLPDVLTSIKYEDNNGRSVAVPYLRPNFTLSDGSSQNYRIRELNYIKFAEILPLPTILKGKIAPNIVAHDGFIFRADIINSEENKVHYPSLSFCLSKNETVRFTLTVDSKFLIGLRQPIKGEFIKQNYGKEATNDGQIQSEIIPFTLIPRIDSFRNHLPCVHTFQRETAYRGVHIVTAKVLDGNGSILFRDSIGIHIE